MEDCNNGLVVMYRNLYIKYIKVKLSLKLRLCQLVLPNTTVVRAGKEAAAEFGKDWGQRRAELCLQPPEPHTLPLGHNLQFTVMYKMPSIS